MLYTDQTASEFLPQPTDIHPIETIPLADGTVLTYCLTVSFAESASSLCIAEYGVEIRCTAPHEPPQCCGASALHTEESAVLQLLHQLAQHRVMPCHLADILCDLRAANRA